MKTKVQYLIISALLLSAHALFATHNRAGEIHVEQLGQLTVRATIITWTKASSVNADRDTLTICWGDGTCEQVPRSNGNGEVKPNDIKYNTYVAVHTYAGPATYRISMTDPNRIKGIVNVNPPSSDNVPFHIETIYTFQDPQFGGTNTTPYLLQPPIDNACVGKPFKHNANAFDPDKDSLSYQLIVPLQSLGTPVPNYSYPSQIVPGINNNLSLNPVNGDLVWNSPQFPGEYNVAFIIVSWRRGVPIDTTIRDMQILVSNCDNNPPVVEAPDQICVIAGDTVQFTVRATDPDSTDRVQLSGLGGPFVTPYSPAVFTAPSGFQNTPVEGVFTWATTCEHISNQSYVVIFKAIDEVSPSIAQLADLKTVNIKVVGPAPEGLLAEANQGSVDLSWDKPYSCEGAAENYFFGFSVWRRDGSNPFPIDTCTPGLAGKGYVQLVYLTKEVNNGRYYFHDENVESGKTYCYRILAKFARTSTGGYPYNVVESLPSEEICIQLPRDRPLITNVTVDQTDVSNGQIKVVWTKPNAFDLDTLVNHGPYRYQLLRADGLSGGTLSPVPGADFSAAAFWQANDTTFTDPNLNTLNQAYHYQVAFYTRGDATPLGNTNAASSVFLNITATDNTNQLSWKETVPWNNYRYVVYRLNPATGTFDSIASRFLPNYDDRGLENGKTYCYKIKSVGTYSIQGIADPLNNWSQEACGTPLDTIPPCVPTLQVSNLCDQNPGGVVLAPPYQNNLSWTNPNLTCPGPADAVQYRLWFAPGPDDTPELLDLINHPNETTYTHLLQTGLAGCYAVSAIDSAGNESALSTLVCVDNCPYYELPNAFTPNGDNANDLYTPFPGWRFIERVDFQVFNRWGNAVFSTTNPEINWDGRTADGNDVAAGAYFYLCKVYEIRVDGTVLQAEIRRGYIEIIR